MSIGLIFFLYPGVASAGLSPVERADWLAPPSVYSVLSPCCLFHPSGLAKFNLIFVKLRLGTPICKIQTVFFRRNKCSNHLGSELDVIKRLDVAIWLLGLAKRKTVSMCCHVKKTHVQVMCRQVSKSQMLSPTFPSKPFTPPWRVDAIAVFFLDNLFDLSRMVHGNCILHISIGPHHVLSFGWCQIKFVCPAQRMGHAPRHFFQFFRSGSASHTKTFELFLFFFFVRRCDCMSINCVYVWVHSYQFDPRTNYVVLWGILPFLFFMQVSSTCDAGQNFQPGVRCRDTMHWWCDGKRWYSVFGFLHVWFVLYRILNCQLEVLIAHGSKSSVAMGQVTVVLLRQLSCSANVP